MREILKDLSENSYWINGIKEGDFYHAVDVVKEMVEARNLEYQGIEKKTRSESPELADDILDDVAYYRYTDNQYLWHFVLWRLQGLLEAVIVHKFLNEKKGKLIGLNKKLIALQKIGWYSINADEIKELKLWAKLRNSFSHAPPEQYRPTPLMQDDVIEYQNLVLRLYRRWKSEELAHKRSS